MKEIETPLVTVILTSYNQQQYISETLDSVFAQTYSNLQIIIIDNASSDETLSRIENRVLGLSELTVIKNTSNLGLCRAFNQGLALAKGKYIIDLSADDIMLPERIDKQVKVFEELGEEYGVIFSNAQYIDTKGKLLNFHYAINKHQKAQYKIPSGDVYKNILRKYFICTPTMMMRTDMLNKLGGYDESLVFEDFDFWVRSSVSCKYFYQDEILTRKRNVPGSLGTHIYKKGNMLLETCYTVCNKAYDLNRDQEEFDLLAARIKTFVRKCFYAQEFELALKFRTLLNYIENPDILTEIIVLLCRLHLPVNKLYRFYLNIFQKKVYKREDFAF